MRSPFSIFWGGLREASGPVYLFNRFFSCITREGNVSSFRAKRIQNKIFLFYERATFFNAISISAQVDAITTRASTK